MSPRKNESEKEVKNSSVKNDQRAVSEKDCLISGTGAADQKIVKENRMFLVFGLMLAAAELWKQLYLTFKIGHGAYQWSYIPWQLCSMPIYVCLLIYISGFCTVSLKNTCIAADSLKRKTEHPAAGSIDNLERNLKSGKDKPGLPYHRPKAALLREALLTFTADFTLMSGCAAFLDTSGMHYESAALTLHSYLWHISIICIGIYAGTRRRDLSFRAYTGAAALYVLFAGIAELINISLDKYGFVNMFYINPHYHMSQIVFRQMTAVLSNDIVIWIYIICSLTAGFLVHMLWRKMYGKYRSDRSGNLWNGSCEDACE